MRCLFDHEWGWPRKRGGKDIQVCLHCGTERESKIHFDPPRYRKTQEGIQNFASTGLPVEAPIRVTRPRELSSAAA
ncbi:MAG TPA: hypothetical protein VHA11_09425 [Bryobacteraceae bacterium]|nr:hypothetical protein [Bryobacteraceae bacterium]